MSELDAQLKQRQKSSLLPLLIATCLALLSVAAIVIYLFIAKGHAIKVLPAEAQEHAQVEIVSGFGFVTDELVYRFASDVKIKVSSPTFFAQEQMLTDSSPAAVTLELKPRPGTLVGKFTQPYGEQTLWIVDGRLLAKGANISEPLAEGEYRLAIENPYYQNQQQTLIVARTQTTEVVAELTPVDGVLELASIPSGAEVYVDGKSMGKTPLRQALTGGSYALELHKPGYQASVENVEITEQYPSVTRQYQLKPEQAYLEITLTPEGGSLFIDGQKVAPGHVAVDANTMHRVRYDKPGFYSFDSKVILPPKEQKFYAITLKPEQGQVSVRSNVEAEVYINGRSRGNTPLNKTLPAIAHEIKVTKPGYRSVVKTITPSAKHDSTVNVTLLPEFEARRQEGQPLFVSTLGMELQLFNMKPFSMGSPANEVGRQRNEFQVRVDFSRPIWVAKHEVTEAQFHAFDKRVPKSQLPVTNISWLTAAQYCNWLSEQEALEPYYRIVNNQFAGINKKARGYRLLSEAEWEWLAKKAKRARATKYVWGDSERVPRDAGNFADVGLKGKQAFYLSDYQDSHTGKAPVGSYRADKAGLYDLAGNVSEWVFDVSSYVTPDLSRVHSDYLGPSGGGNHIAKGGNYQSGRLQDLRAALKIVADGPSETIGFRIARYER
ncbi:PEGA domain-containing protein [Pseudoalteromonas sp. T1lg75]|uniref:PEGA domain-containing protein n=1 Tax=Pseudoalteromonas sp. T1lg75 TaxID=2077102 RepID=UPI000CF6B913|nr:PEGA domain-containing protein [Pseudoalteromonas sp. T1lg75]